MSLRIIVEMLKAPQVHRKRFGEPRW